MDAKLCWKLCWPVKSGSREGICYKIVVGRDTIGKVRRLNLMLLIKRGFVLSHVELKSTRKRISFLKYTFCIQYKYRVFVSVNWSDLLSFVQACSTTSSQRACKQMTMRYIYPIFTKYQKMPPTILQKNTFLLFLGLGFPLCRPKHWRKTSKRETK